MPEPGFVFEVSWEVCNKVGGIYTVVRSKAGQMIERYKDSYFAIGPYFVKKLSGEFQEKPAPEFLKDHFDELRKEGIDCHYGTWLIEGEPNAILIDFVGFTKNTNEIKRELWDLYKVDSLNTNYFDFDEPVVWSYAAGKVIEKISRKQRAVAHFHEWLSGAGLLYLKSRKASAATVFTTHATVLGRSMASANIDLYSVFGKIDPDQEAYKFGIHFKHQVEKNAAKESDVFTTVSEITGMEAEKLLGRKPEIILPNGLNIEKFPTFDEAAMKHSHFKWRIKEFLMFYFFPYYTFDLEETLIYFIIGRYEFKDKGIDIFIRSLAKLNQKLKQDKSPKTIVAFFFIPGNIRAIKPDLLESRTYYEDIRESVDDAMYKLKERVICLSLSQKKITDEDLLGKDLMFEMKRKMSRIFRKGLPSLCTHDLFDEQADPILNSLKQERLENKPDDKVKVVFYPIYLTGADRLLDLNYYESIEGGHLGIFPSFYEPWGYTPLEAGALGISSVTTDLAGFGKFIEKETQKKRDKGIFVIKRMGRSDDEAVEQLTAVMHNYSKMTKEERIRNKIEAKHLASHADWKNFARNYFDAHSLAMRNKWGK